MLARLDHKAAQRHHVCDAERQLDPTGTSGLRRRMRVGLNQRLHAFTQLLRAALVAEDQWGLASTSVINVQALVLQGDRVHAFQAFTDELLRQTFMKDGGAWLRPYTELAYRKGFARAMRLAKRDAAQDAQRIVTLWRKSVVEMQGAMEALSQGIVRTFADAVLMKEKPGVAMRDMQAVMTRVQRRRFDALASITVVSAHAQATLDAFERTGVQLVGVLPEHVIGFRAVAVGDAPRKKKKAKPKRYREGSRATQPSARTLRRIRQRQSALEVLGRVNILTAGDDKVCPICEDLSEGGPYTINRARALIPAHPKCRCAFVPADDRRFARDYDPDQPRDPKGTSTGGQWTKGGAVARGGEHEENEEDLRTFEQKIENIARRLDYPVQKVEASDEAHEFKLEGKVYNAAATCDLKTGGIVVYRRYVGSRGTLGTMAHEIMHAKFQKVLDQYVKESNALGAEPEYLTGVDIDTGEIKDLALRNKYPTYDTFHKFLNNTRRLSEEDGVTPYSKAYWREWAKGNVETKIAIHETLAEIAAEQMGRGVKVGSKSYRELYEEVQTEYRRLRFRAPT